MIKITTPARTISPARVAVVGLVLIPIAGFTLLRYVPIGHALAETILATAVGGAVGVQFLGGWWLVGPLAGFGLAAVRLWALAPRKRASRCLLLIHSPFRAELLG